MCACRPLSVPVVNGFIRQDIPPKKRTHQIRSVSMHPFSTHYVDLTVYTFFMNFTQNALNDSNICV